MTDNEDVAVDVAVEEKEPAEGTLDYMKMIEDKEREIRSLKAHTQELLDETKRAKKRAEEQAMEKARLKEEQLAKDGKFEQLYKSANERYEQAMAELRLRDERTAKEIVKSEAIKLASQLSDGYNAELLAEFMKSRIKYTDEGLKVLDGHGNATVSSLDDLKNEFANSDKYKSLIRGSRATGGGARGAGGGAASASLIDKAVFDSWTPKQQMEFSLKGGKVK